MSYDYLPSHYGELTSSYSPRLWPLIAKSLISSLRLRFHSSKGVCVTLIRSPFCLVSSCCVFIHFNHGVVLLYFYTLKTHCLKIVPHELFTVVIIFKDVLTLTVDTATILQLNQRLQRFSVFPQDFP